MIGDYLDTPPAIQAGLPYLVFTDGECRLGLLAPHLCIFKMLGVGNSTMSQSPNFFDPSPAPVWLNISSHIGIKGNERSDLLANVERRRSALLFGRISISPGPRDEEEEQEILQGELSVWGHEGPPPPTHQKRPPPPPRPPGTWHAATLV